MHTQNTTITHREKPALCSTHATLDVIITGLPEDLFNLPLKSLSIGYCKKLPLDVIDTICQKLPQLESLGLSGLQMTGEW